MIGANVKIQMKPGISAAAILLVCGLQACSKLESAPQILFDDFTYADHQQLTTNGWIIRTATGWPGIENASWGPDRISFHDDAEQAGNRLVRMSSETDGSSANTRQSQFCHARKYFEGTYAARVYFRDAPTFGPDGDQVVQTFYTVSPQKAPMDLDYSEADFEYLPNGGWENPELSMFATTWETYQLEPWTKDNISDVQHGSLEGWHILVMQIGEGKVRYFVDGTPLAEHGGHVYPEVPMSINFNLWFTREGPIAATELRQYQQDIDWVFHRANVLLTPEQVKVKVAELRNKNIAFEDSVPAQSPPLVSPCDF
jgi:hypothetical protein